MKCTSCKKENISPENMHSDAFCDDCFDLMMDLEEKQFDIYYSQNSKCFLCQKELSSWIIKPIEGAEVAVCWTDCNNALSPAIRLVAKDGKLSAE